MTIMLFLSVVGSWISIAGYDSLAPEITLLEADNNHAVIQLDISGYDMESYTGYSHLSIQDNWNMDTPVGHPELPMVSVVVGIPAGMEPSATLVNAEWISAGTGLPYPVQPLRTDDAVGPFTFVDISSELQGVYPQSTVNLFEQGSWAGVNTVVLQMHPITWNAENNEFMVASSITAQVDFHGTRELQVAVRPEIANMHRAEIVNYESLNITVNSSAVTMDDIVYICVVPPENLKSVTPFLAMINALGHHVHIIEVEPKLTSREIRDKIKEVYQKGITRFAVIPAEYSQVTSNMYDTFVGDFYYELMDADNLPDIAVGRYSGDSTTLENQVAKTMSYMTYHGIQGEPSIPASVVLATHQEDYPGKYTANSNRIMAYNYSLAKLVFKKVYPPEGGTRADLIEAIKNGIGIVNYRGHGDYGIWQWSPGWYAGHIRSLKNTYYPPVFNVCCNNGTHERSTRCLSESWMAFPETGASGNLGASAPSYTAVNDRMQLALFKDIFHNGITCAGEVVTASQTYIVRKCGTGGLKNARMYHWFGDPSMDIPNSDVSGAPFAMAVNAPEYLVPGDRTLKMTVTSGGSPVEGAVVTVTDGIGNHPSHIESFYQQTVSNSSGQVNLKFTVIQGSTLYYGVRLHNHASVTGTITVAATGIEENVIAAAELLPVTPSPVSGMANISFTAPEDIEMKINVMDLSGRVVNTIQSGQVPAGAGSILLDASEYSPGVYFVIMQTPDMTVTRRMAVVH